MVAHAIRKPVRGARPFNPARDLSAVARLLEEAFRPEHTFPLSDLPVLREIGIVLWTMSYAPVFPESVSGFVWLEEGRIVGNVTLSQDEGRLDRYLVSNVAVKPEYRRQGIARALMQVTLDHVRERGGRSVLLNVRPTNPGAIKLYRDLGFEEIEMRGEWSASPPPPALRASPSPSPERTPFRRRGGGLGGGGEVRPLRSSDQRAVADLVRATTPESVQRYRPPRWTELSPTWEDRLGETITDAFIGQTTRRWALELDGRLASLLLVRGQRIFTPHRVTTVVHPEARGRVEADLVALALRELSRLPRREIRAAATSTHPELIAALEAQGFAFRNGLTLMALAIP